MFLNRDDANVQRFTRTLAFKDIKRQVSMNADKPTIGWFIKIFSNPTYNPLEASIITRSIKAYAKEHGNYLIDKIRDYLALHIGLVRYNIYEMRAKRIITEIRDVMQILSLACGMTLSDLKKKPSFAEMSIDKSGYFTTVTYNLAKLENMLEMDYVKYIETGEL